MKPTSPSLTEQGMKIFECKDMPGRYHHPLGYGTIGHWTATGIWPKAEYVPADEWTPEDMEEEQERWNDTQ